MGFSCFVLGILFLGFGHSEVLFFFVFVSLPFLLSGFCESLCLFWGRGIVSAIGWQDMLCVFSSVSEILRLSV